jgi:hypothetical protein
MTLSPTTRTGASICDKAYRRDLDRVFAHRDINKAEFADAIGRGMAIGVEEADRCLRHRAVRTGDGPPNGAGTGSLRS